MQRRRGGGGRGQTPRRGRTQIIPTHFEPTRGRGSLPLSECPLQHTVHPSDETVELSPVGRLRSHATARTMCLGSILWVANNASAVEWIARAGGDG
jgi:hypothetical protein